jgi:hypothetical protein
MRPLLLVLALCACGDDDLAPEAPRTDQPVDPVRTDEPREFTAETARSLGDGVLALEIEGAALGLEGDRALSALDKDLDGDGDRDAFVVTRNATDVRLLHFRRDGDRFTSARALGRTPVAPECTPTIELATLSRAIAVARIEGACEPPVRAALVASIEAEPRLLEQLAVLPPEGRVAGDMTLSFRAADQDDDEHDDLVATVAWTGDERVSTDLSFLDRPGGLARDTSEPEASLASLASRAETLLAGDAAAARATAERALALHAALCRERGESRLELSETAGIVCGPSAAAGKAASVRAMALARLGDVFGALAAAQDAEHDAFRLSRADRRRIDGALQALPASAGSRVHRGPEVRRAASPRQHLPAIAFLDPNRILLREEVPRVFLVDTAETRPADALEVLGASTVIVDPSGGLAAVDIGRTCDGHVLRIVRARDVAQGVVLGRPLVEPALDPRPAPRPCPPLAASLRDDSGGFRIVGWTPQGVVAVRRDRVRLVPLQMSGQPAGEASDIGPDTPLPAPFPLGAMTRDGSAYAWIAEIGVVVRKTDGSGTTLVRLPTWPAGGEGVDPFDVAISEDARRVAYIEGSVLVVVEL